MRVEEFVQIKMKKVEEKADVYEILQEAQYSIIDYSVKRAHNQKYANLTSQLYSQLNNKRVAKALKAMQKEGDLQEDFAMVLSQFLNYASRNNDKKFNPDVIELYGELIILLLKKRAKKISKATDIPKDLVIDLLVVIPDRKYMKNEKYVRIFMQKVLRKLYVIARTNPNVITESDQIKKFFEIVFGEEFLDIIAIYVLLERKETISKFNEDQVAVFNKITVFALDLIDSQKKKHIKEMLQHYINIRKADAKNNRDTTRRVNLSAFNEDMYDKIPKVVAKLKEDNEDNARYL